MKHILKCKSCGTYTIKSVCPECGKEAVTPVPAKYSPDDKYGKYRRKVKLPLLKKAELI